MVAAQMKYRIKGTKLYVQPAPARASVNYDAASTASRIVRWRPGGGGPNTVLNGALPTLRNRSRDVRRKDGLADNAIETHVSNIIGTGIAPRFNVPDNDLKKEIGEAWLEWTDEADADGRFDFYGLQALAVGSTAEGGDCFTRIRIRRPEDGLSVPLQLQVLEGEYCPDDKNELAANGNVIRAGVEFDRIGRRVAYHLYREHPADWIMQGFTGNNVFTVPVPASEVVHLALSKRPGMIRGEPWLTRALIKLHELDEYDDAQLVRQKIAALFAGFVETEMPEGMGDENEVFAGQGDADANNVSLAPLEPGTMQVLEPGKKLNWSSPPNPGDNYEAFVRQQERRIALSAGIIYEQASGDYSKTNDRQFRAAINEFRRRCQRLQHQLVVFQYCRPIANRWIEMAVLSGRVRLRSGITVADIIRSVKWVPQGWQYLNPVQDVQAKKAEVRSGFKSLRQMVTEQGDDLDDLFDEVAGDNERADDLGLVFDSDPRRTSGAGQEQVADSEPNTDPQDEPREERAQ